MSNQQHTPWPWSIEHEDGLTFIVGSDGRRIAKMLSTHANNTEYSAHQARAKRNARLIAAAPELLSALEDCERNMIISTQTDMARLDRIRAAIAKAKP